MGTVILMVLAFTNGPAYMVGTGHVARSLMAGHLGSFRKVPGSLDYRVQGQVRSQILGFMSKPTCPGSFLTVSQFPCLTVKW